ncbi:hypothetical protein, partial [Mycobacterium simiae]|uniref:hypothetical protein n=1 Tax=Mycobacterium simiae TaxID=1784 RepID=UPI001E4016EC
MRTSARMAVGVLPRSPGWRAGGARLVVSAEFHDAVAARIAYECFYAPTHLDIDTMMLHRASWLVVVGVGRV